MILEQLEYWHWWVFATALLILEILAPGAFFLWMGIASAVVGLLLLIAPGMDWTVQFILFSLLSVSSIIVWRRRLAKQPTQSDQPMLNQRGQQYVGRQFTLEQAITNGTGKLHVDDSMWKIVGEDCQAGTQVRVTQADGAVLKVEVIKP